MYCDRLPPECRTRVAAASSQFLLRHDYVSLFEAAEIREMAVEKLWNAALLKDMDDSSHVALLKHMDDVIGWLKRLLRLGP